MPFDRKLRDQLCALEPQNPVLRERYTRELQAMFERKLSSSMKVFLAVVTASSVVIMIFLGWMAVVQDRLPLLARLGMAGGALFSLAWAIMSGWTIKKGAWNLRTHPAILAALAWVFAVLLETCFLLLAPAFPEPFQATIALFAGLVILIGAGVTLVSTSIQQATLRTEESLLRLEYRLAEFMEAQGKAT